MPVGIGERKENFALYTIDAKQGDTLYLYTDGFADQFGGPKGKKFKYKQLNELLLSINSKTLNEQSKLLRETFDNWRGNLEQVDDVCIIGIKI
jgi:serine phosphatase RsbU (regulator of sigma subunit)